MTGEKREQKANQTLGKRAGRGAKRLYMKQIQTYHTHLTRMSCLLEQMSWHKQSLNRLPKWVVACKLYCCKKGQPQAGAPEKNMVGQESYGASSYGLQVSFSFWELLSSHRNHTLRI